MSPTGWLKATEVYCLTVLEARSSKSRCLQGRAPSGLREESFLASSSCWWWPLNLSVPWLPALSQASLQTLPLSSREPSPCGSVFTWPSLLLEGHSHNGIGPILLTPSEPDYIRKDPISKSALIHRYWGLEFQHICLGNKTQPIKGG